MEQLLQVGVISSTHGIRGEVKVFPTTDDPDRFRKLKQVILDTGREQKGLEIEGVKFFKQFVILKFKDIDNINDIEKYKGKSLYVTREHAVKLKEDENFIADPGLHRTIMGDGLATAFAGLIGGPANTTYGENTGVLELSKVYDPRVIRIAAVFAIILSFIPKFSSVISTMPTAIIGGISFMLYGMISAIGVRNVVENKVDLTKSRNLIIAGVIFVCGLGFSNGLTFTIGETHITLTALAIAAIAGIILNAILPGNDYRFGVNPSGDQSRGVYVSNTDDEK